MRRMQDMPPVRWRMMRGMNLRGRGFAVLIASLIGVFAFASFVITAAAAPDGSSQASTPASQASSPASASDAKLVETGSAVFQKNCSFCHGRDAEGGETGPDLTRSRLVAADVKGNLISTVVRNGRPARGMPSFNLSDSDLAAVVAFIHARLETAENGARRGVDVADLQTGNAAAGKAFFFGAGTCSKCHSPTGDLAGLASRYEGLALERRFLYPGNVKPKVSVTTKSGEKLEGQLESLDEFTIAMVDSQGNYHSWPVSSVTYKVDPGLDTHFALLGKYSDDDVHNMMSYLETLK